ncbi:MAG: molybdate ABC transporter substrate-binding protein [Sneathiella sp.]
MPRMEFFKTVIKASIRAGICVALFLGAASSSPTAQGKTANVTYVAMASNFTSAGKEIASAFEKKTGHRALLSFGSTGKLYIQITNGAPFEVFLSADTQTAKKIEAVGLSIPGTRFTYALGKIALYSSDPDLIENNAEVLSNPAAFSRLAIANPKTAPYGRAAVETLMKLGIYADVKDKIVKGSNIAQAFQFVFTGNAQMGFAALSQVKNISEGSNWIVPSHFYTPIKQDAILLRRGETNPIASAFFKFLKSEKARRIIEKYGYDAN